MGAVTAQSDLFKEGARKLGVELSQEYVDRLLIYLQELILWNTKIDLVSQTDPELIIRKHFLDSIAVLPHIQGSLSILDIGSGAGFPGIPLAILLPDSSVSLIEVKRKRINFLRQAARKIKGENLTVYEGRAEILAQESILENAFDLVISRATWDTPTFLRLAVPFVRCGGKILAMKGSRKDDAIFLSSFSKNGTWRVRQYDYTLPFGSEQRRLVTFSSSVPRDT
jgi:16S rRNA (guanine527-N7)-methyltransferase